MKEETPIDAKALIDEILRYLGVVDSFRAERCEPRWLPERSSGGTRSGRRFEREASSSSDARLA
jgi:hypothetical protein